LRARKPQGSVVYNKARATWNFLWVESGLRKSRKLGTLADLPTRAAALKKAETVRRTLRLIAARSIPTVKDLVEQYRAERMPQRYSTRRSYEAWLRLYILPRWGESSITLLQARPVEIWLLSLELAPRSKSSIRGLLNILWDYSMWRGDVPTQRNPIQLVTIKRRE
jgi:integrase